MVGQPHQHEHGQQLRKHLGRGKQFLGQRHRQRYGFKRNQHHLGVRAHDGQQLHGCQQFGNAGRRRHGCGRLQCHPRLPEQRGHETAPTLVQREHVWQPVEHHSSRLAVGLRGAARSKSGPFLPVNQQHVAGQQERLGFTQRSDRRRGRRNGAVHDVGLPQWRQPEQFQQQFHRHAGSIDRRLHSLRREHFLRRSCCLDGPGRSGVQNRARRRRGGRR